MKLISEEKIKSELELKYPYRNDRNSGNVLCYVKRFAFIDGIEFANTELQNEEAIAERLRKLPKAGDTVEVDGSTYILVGSDNCKGCAFHDEEMGCIHPNSGCVDGKYKFIEE